jgi:hypothetical protein
METIQDRIRFYLGGLSVTQLDDLDVMTVDDLIDPVRAVPLKKILEKNNLADRKFCAFWGDNQSETSPACLVKNRYNSNHSVILRCINFNRHWKLYYNRPSDIDFDKKKNKVFWRGTTTGNMNRPGNRFTLVKKWFDHPSINVGFSKIGKAKERYYEYEQYVKGQSDPEDFLKYKYILSVEGNDKDSGINWKLNSNSLVMMARPRCTSWLMETTLVPDYHYILVKDDFSDLEEKLRWCNKHPEECKQIIQNANDYMRQFSDEKVERTIENKVIRAYFKRVY